MIFVDRSRVPEPVELQKAREAELELAKKHFEAGKPAKDFKFTAYGLEAVRTAINELFHYKCAYCETNYGAGQPVDVEHYRPKGRVVVSRKPRQEILGYWWLAARWDNLLGSCIFCNRPNKLETASGGGSATLGKSDLFPLIDEARRAQKEGDESGEAALLINPCECDPERYIAFVLQDGRWIAQPRAIDIESVEHQRARTTIDVIGLDRKYLVEKRTERVMDMLALAEVAKNAHEAIALDPSGPTVSVHRANRDIMIKLIKEAIAPEAHWSAAVKAAVRPKLAEMGLTV